MEFTEIVFFKNLIPTAEVHGCLILTDFLELGIYYNQMSCK